VRYWWKRWKYRFLVTLGGGNVRWGHSNKCLMRGTFRAICKIVFFRVFRVFPTVAPLEKKNASKNWKVETQVFERNWVWQNPGFGDFWGVFPLFVRELVHSKGVKPAFSSENDLKFIKSIKIYKFINKLIKSKKFYKKFVSKIIYKVIDNFIKLFWLN